MNILEARQRVVPLSDPSGVGEARRVIAALGNSIALDEARAGDLALAVTEAATNIVKHAGEGTLVGRIIARNGLRGIEVLALDRGAGISNVTFSMRDGYSTSGTAGQGLGALRRATSGLEIWSNPAKGTILRFEVWPDSGELGEATAVMGVIAAEKVGEVTTGDGWSIREEPDRVLVFVGDGLGHGPEAAAAIQTAIATVEKHPHLEPAAIMSVVHDALRSTRGAAGAIAVLRPRSQQCEFCGVGNISATIRIGGKGHSMVSNNGTLGQHIRKLQPFRYDFPANAMFIAHSDGITTHWDLAQYPGLESRHPAMVAAILFRDHNRGRDDVTVLALRNCARSSA